MYSDRRYIMHELIINTMYKRFIKLLITLITIYKALIILYVGILTSILFSFFISSEINHIFKLKHYMCMWYSIITYIISVAEN